MRQRHQKHTSAHSLPTIGVMPSREQKGANSLIMVEQGKVQGLQTLPLDAALAEPWPTDAHFVTYRPTDPAIETWPRCNKPILSELRVRGVDLLTTMLVFDYDRPEHRAWDAAYPAPGIEPDGGPTTEQWYDGFIQCVSKSPPLDQWSCIYTTRNGARIIYVLSAPIPVDDAEQMHRAMVRRLRNAGVMVDAGCSDWTRVFRLPFVVRDGEPSWDRPLSDRMIFECRWDQRLDPGEISERMDASSLSDYADVRPFIVDKPPREAVESLLQAPSRSGRIGATGWLKEAKRRLTGRECFPCLFEHQPLAQPGSRDNTLHAYIGQAIGLLYYVTGTTPEHIYALFLDPVEQLNVAGDTDTEGQDWTDTLWDHIGRLWQKEDAKARARLSEYEQEHEQAREITDCVLMGMAEWCSHPSLKQGKQEALAWAHQHFIASVNNNYFVMGPDGWYDTIQLLKHQIVPRVREIGMEGLIQTKYLDGNNQIRDVGVDKLVSTYGTVVSEIRGEPSLKGTYIKGLGKRSATMVVPTYKRNPYLTPQYHGLVDEWLHKFFGNHYYKACEWISWALAFEEGPICALSIEGAPGSGKQMLVRGLAECLERPAMATADDMMGDHEYGLYESPWLIINEGWPQHKSKGMHPADRFRHLVAGDPFSVRMKYRAPIQVSNPVRIIFTANNSEVVRTLTGNRNLSPEDREALAVRLLHFKCGQDAATWLRAHGGMRFTRGWVASHGENQSDYIVARHFLWLWANRTGVRGSRLLVEGNYHDEVVWEMRMQSGSAPLVVETLIQMIEGARPLEGLAIEDDGRVFVLASEILKYWRAASMQRHTGERLSASQIEQVLKGLVVRMPGSAMMLDSKPKAGKAMWHELDVECLLASAQKGGWVAPKLEQIVQRRKISTSLEGAAQRPEAGTLNGTHVVVPDEQPDEQPTERGGISGLLRRAAER
jgi:hypothetical protein